jgi:hypothetical protein
MLTSKRTRLACGIAIVALAVSAGPAATLHVDPNDPTAFPTIQKAIDAAKSFDTVVVHPGVYRETIDFGGKPITVTSMDPNDPAVVAGTVVDPNRTGWPYVYVVSFRNGETEHSVLRGLTIRGGNSGIRCDPDYARPTVRQCVITSNWGNGMEGGHPTVTDCTVAENSNIGIIAGGSAVIEGCIIAANRLAGVDSHGKVGTLFIRHSLICGNGTEGVGCGLDGCNIEVVNCTVVGNERGLALYAKGCSVSNSIIAYNKQSGLDGNLVSKYNDLYANMRNWAVDTMRGEGDIEEEPYFANLEYSAGTWRRGDYHLVSTVGRWDPPAKAWVKDPIDSPCIDRGDPNTPFLDEPSPNGGRINMGAYGGTAEASKSIIPGATCVEYPAMDFNHDCKVDQADLDIFMQHWLECGLDDPNACWPNGPPATPVVQP